MNYAKLVNKGCCFSALILFLIGCSFERKENAFVYSDFINKDSLEIALPLEYLSITNWTTYKSGEKKILVEYGLNGDGDLVIHQIDFDKKIYLDPIYIPREGPDGFNSSEASVFFKSKDSIYVFPSARSSFFLYNSIGVKVEEYRYNSLIEDRYYKNGWYSSMAFFEDLFILPTVDDTRYDDPDFFDKVSPIQFYDLDSNRFIDQINFPEFVRGKYLPSNFSGAMMDQVDIIRILINYKFSDSIYIYNIRERVMDGFYCGSENFGRPNLLNYLPDRAQSLEYIIKEVDYETAFFHKEKIYRVVNHLLASKYREMNPFEIIQNNYKVVSLIELDLVSKKLKYYKLPIAKYFVFQGDQLFAGGVSVREENGDIYRKFYRYTLN